MGSNGFDHLAVIDIETTGLDAGTDLILEVGVVIVDPQLREVAHRSVLITTRDTVAWARRTRKQAREVRYPTLELDPAQQMHLDNGLVDDLLSPRPLKPNAVGLDLQSQMIASDYSVAAQQLCMFLDRHLIIYPVPMVGSSVRSLDAPFLEAHMPALHDRFNHRTIDASALLELSRFIDPSGFDAMTSTIGASSHRTIGDCRRSLDTIRSFAARYGIGDVGISGPDER